MNNFIEEVKNGKGNPIGLAITEFIVFFCGSFGFSDFTLHSLVFKKTGWVEDAILPGTMIMAYLLPGYIYAAVYLTGAVEYDLKTLICCVIANACGCFIGSKLVLSFDGNRIKKIIGVAMIFSMIMLVVKLVISQGVSGTQIGLEGWQFYVAIPIIFVVGIFNMMGVASKPPLMSMFLLMGLSPMTVLTILMTQCIFGPTIGGINFVRSGKFQKKVFAYSLVFGSLGALVGTRFAFDLNPIILTVAMIVAMGIVSYTMLKPGKK